MSCLTRDSAFADLLTRFEQHLVALGCSASQIADGLRCLRPLQSKAKLLELALGDTLLEEGAKGHSIYFLLSGRLAFWSNADCEVMLAQTDQPWTVAGWSALAAPGRHLAHATAETTSDFLAIPCADLHALLATAPSVEAWFLDWLFAETAPNLMPSEPPHDQTASAALRLAPAVTPRDQEHMLTSLDRAPFLSDFSPQAVRVLASVLRPIVLRPGEVLTLQGGRSPGLVFLLWGDIELKRRPLDQLDQASRTHDPAMEHQILTRHVTKPGQVLALTDLCGRLPSIYAVTAQRDTRLAVLSGPQMQALIASHPFLVRGLIFKQFWQLARYLRWSAALMAAETSEGAIALLASLARDNRQLLPSDSDVFAAAAMAVQPETRSHALRLLQRLHIGGTQIERGVAAIALDAMSSIKREVRVRRGLAQACDVALQGEDGGRPQAVIRHNFAMALQEAFEHAAYYIEGWDNLPQSSNCIFIFNRLPESEAIANPNGHNLDLCASFVSAQICQRAYNSPGCLLRSGNKLTPLDMMRGAVLAPQDAAHMHSAIDEYQRVLDEGAPFILALEGDTVGSDITTLTSPGAIKAGAFFLAAHLPSKPTIVPLVLAGLDASPADAVYRVAIMPPIHTDDFPDLEQTSARLAYLRDFRRLYRSWVQTLDEKPISLADVGESGQETGLLHNLESVGRLESEFEFDVTETEVRTRRRHSDGKAVVFYGSSSIRYWENLTSDMDLKQAVNLGFGGSTIPACYAYFDRLVGPYHPGGLVFYAGDNDLGRGTSPQAVTQHFLRFANRVHDRFPNCRCVLVSLKPSPHRADLLPLFRETNALLEQEVDRLANWRFVSIFEAMLDGDGNPRAELFIEDQLHMNAAGYALWRTALLPLLPWLTRQI